MSKKISKEDIKKIMSRVWGVPQESIPDQAAFNVFVPWDSFGHINLFLELEKSYNIELTETNLTMLITLDKILSKLANNN